MDGRFEQVIRMSTKIVRSSKVTLVGKECATRFPEHYYSSYEGLLGRELDGAELTSSHRKHEQTNVRLKHGTSELVRDS